jgi:glutathione S-transferase
MIATPRVSNLQLLGPAWTRTFRCLWMLEELLQPFHEAKASSSAAAAAAAAAASWPSKQEPPPFEYCLISHAKPTSKLVRQYVSTGKVPILLVYRNNDDDVGDVGSDSHHEIPDATTKTSNVDNMESLHRQRQPDLILSESSAINTYLADHYGGIALGLIPSPSIPALPEDAVSSRQENEQYGQRAIYDMVVSCLVTELDAQGLWMHSKHEKMAQHFGHIPTAVSHAREHFVRMNAHLVSSYLQQPAAAVTTSGASPLSSPSSSTAPHSRRLYLLGNAFTAADILYVHCLEWSIAIGWWTIDHDKYDDSHAPPSSLRLSNADQQATLHDYYERCRCRPAFQRAAQLRNKKPTSNTNHPNNSKL